MDSTDNRDLAFARKFADKNLILFGTDATDLASYKMAGEDGAEFTPILGTPLGYAGARKLAGDQFCICVVPAGDATDNLKKFFNEPWKRPWGTKRKSFTLVVTSAEQLLDAVKLVARALLSGKDRERMTNCKSDVAMGCTVNRVINAVILDPDGENDQPVGVEAGGGAYTGWTPEQLATEIKRRKLPGSGAASTKWKRETLIMKLVANDRARALLTAPLPLPVADTAAAAGDNAVS